VELRNSSAAAASPALARAATHWSSHIRAARPGQDIFRFVQRDCLTHTRVAGNENCNKISDEDHTRMATNTRDCRRQSNARFKICRNLLSILVKMIEKR
jgi:hypothetical protein